MLNNCCRAYLSSRCFGAASVTFVFGVGSARGPDCPSKSEVAQGFDLIPVSVDGAGVRVGGVEQKEEKPGMPRSD